ncbi:MAG: hypothetical protein C4297_11150 [Gemmataceae bacterium]
MLPGLSFLPAGVLAQSLHNGTPSCDVSAEVLAPSSASACFREEIQAALVLRLDKSDLPGHNQTARDSSSILASSVWSATVFSSSAVYVAVYADAQAPAVWQHIHPDRWVQMLMGHEANSRWILLGTGCRGIQRL